MSTRQWPNKYHFHFTKPAVLVIDMQNDFCGEEGAYHRNDPEVFQVASIQEMVPRLQRFLAVAREIGFPVVFCKYLLDDHARDGGVYVTARPFLLKEGLRRNTWGGEIIDELRPLEDDFVVEKSRYSGFYNTNLEVVLRALDVDTLLFTGVATNVCVESTIRDAFFRDYQCVLVEDCCKAWNDPAHLATINNVIHGFGMVLTSEEILSELTKK
ncbi:MAG: cysteine hydrolase [bacterium]